MYSQIEKVIVKNEINACPRQKVQKYSTKITT